MEKPEFKGFSFFLNTVEEIAACLYTNVSEPLEGEMLQEKGDHFQSDVFG